MEFLKNFIRGILMGTFEVVPGISGGTLAVILNIYDRLIFAVNHLKDDFKNNVLYLLTIVSGMGVGIYSFSHVVMFCDENYPMETNFLLLGLIVGLIPMLITRSIGKKLKIVNSIPFFLTFAFITVVNYFSSVGDYSGKVVTSLHGLEFLKFAVVGALSAFCLVLPGCSGVLMMYVFGIYDSVMGAVHSFNFLIILPVGAGILFGLLIGTKSMEFSLKHCAEATYFGILGLIVGSCATPCLRFLRAFFETVKSFENCAFSEEFVVHGTVAALLLVLGMVFSYMFTRNAKEIEIKC